MRLFVDCDDTLILWDEPRIGNIGHNVQGLWRGDSYTLNKPLIEAIKKFIQDKDITLIVWSGGGTQYASYWAKRYLPEHDLAIGKDKYTQEELVRESDICIDDVEIKVAGKLMTPDEFIAVVA